MDNIDHIISLGKELNELCNSELKRLDRVVNNTIKSNIRDEDFLSHLFDQLLNLMFSDTNKLIKIYYKLLNYVKTFNIELSNDYEMFFLEDFELTKEDVNKVLKKSNNKK